MNIRDLFASQGCCIEKALCKSNLQKFFSSLQWIFFFLLGNFKSKHYVIYNYNKKCTSKFVDLESEPKAVRMTFEL